MWKISNVETPDCLDEYILNHTIRLKLSLIKLYFAVDNFTKCKTCGTHQPRKIIVIASEENFPGLKRHKSRERNKKRAFPPWDDRVMHPRQNFPRGKTKSKGVISTVIVSFICCVRRTSRKRTDQEIVRKHTNHDKRMKLLRFLVVTTFRRLLGKLVFHPRTTLVLSMN